MTNVPSVLLGLPLVDEPAPFAREMSFAHLPTATYRMVHDMNLTVMTAMTSPLLRHLVPVLLMTKKILSKALLPRIRLDALTRVGLIISSLLRMEAQVPEMTARVLLLRKFEIHDHPYDFFLLSIHIYTRLNVLFYTHTMGIQTTSWKKGWH